MSLFFTHLVEEYEKHATPGRVITFYITSLRAAVGLGWLAPSLLFLAQYWFHPSGACETLPQVLVFMWFRVTVEIRLAARASFGAAAARLSDEDTIGLVEYWQHECECPPKVYLRRTHSPYRSTTGLQPDAESNLTTPTRLSRCFLRVAWPPKGTRCFRQGPHLAYVSHYLYLKLATLRSAP